MIALGFGILWVGYLELVYGYCLLKGYDIPWKQLANPIHPYQWPRPGQAIQAIPPGQVLPTSTRATASQGGAIPQ